MKDESDEWFCIVRGGGKPCRASRWSAEHDADDLEKIVKSHLPGERQEASCSMLGGYSAVPFGDRVAPRGLGPHPGGDKQERTVTDGMICDLLVVCVLLVYPLVSMMARARATRNQKRIIKSI